MGRPARWPDFEFDGRGSMTSQLIKIAGIWALSAATVAGVSLFATNALADEADENDDVAITADDEADTDVVDDNDVADVDEGTIAESNDAIIRRGWYRYPGFYYRWPGYRF